MRTFINKFQQVCRVSLTKWTSS